jgi:hypothetical protein
LHGIAAAILLQGILRKSVRSGTFYRRFQQAATFASWRLKGENPLSVPDRRKVHSFFSRAIAAIPGMIIRQ